MIKSTWRSALMALSCLFAQAVMPAYASVSVDDMIRYGMPPDLAEHAANVSRSEGTWTSLNQYGCAGAFQFCPATRREYQPNISREQFLASPSIQVDTWLRYQERQWSLASRNNFTDLIGQEVCHNGQCGTITASGILKACQFGCASSGALGNFYRTGNCSDPRAADGNNHSVCNFLIGGSGNNVEDITGMPEDMIPRGEWDGQQFAEGGDGAVGPPMILMLWEIHTPQSKIALPGELVR